MRRTLAFITLVLGLTLLAAPSASAAIAAEIENRGARWCARHLDDWAMTNTPRVSVASRAHRALRDIPRFKFAAALDLDADPLNGLKAEYGELIGVYENPQETDPKWVVIAEQAIGCIGNGPPRWILFDDIETTEGPREKMIDNIVIVVLKSGIRTELRIAGGGDRFKDVFGFVRFLDRVVEDRRPSD
jgi:hypothetical protein